MSSAASHNVGARNAIENFEVDQRLEMLRVPLVTILAREMRLKFFQVDQALEMLRVPLVTILVRELRLKKFCTAILHWPFLKTLEPAPLSRTRPGRENGDACRARWPACAHVHVSVGCGRAIEPLPTGLHLHLHSLQSTDRYRGKTQ